MDEPEEPRYRRIAAELRGRIEAGELAVGDRVPSTREITRQWGVAMATATRVLTELRQTGLVRAVPGVGTVVAAAPRASGPQASGPQAAASQALAAPQAPAAASPRPARRAAQEGALTPERIVAAAIGIADQEGLAAVSMRRVAAELGVATMSLYRHVADKDGLLVQMMDRAFTEWPLPADPPRGWRERLELATRMMWAMFRRHPWLASALSVTRPQPVAGAIPYSEWVLASLAAQGLDLGTAFNAHLMLFNHVRGTAVNVESELEAQAHSGIDNEEWMDSQEPALHAIMAGGDFPMMNRLVAEGYDFDLDALFEFGLQRLLDGLAVLIEREK
ncbi:TetR/AcrR family transcriptional regulator C-terminal domain-containing protein [Kitasatospora sp. RB6PN24]|uniref:TetR/AcrR family transcriptional regulator n=1 Tax=Kitasatospora humi TaxID=2893891 RepID=UPI001E5D76C5|nr:TetR/AcrR family transcriptional regulator C-terminal domain-containing protein [Kitasatospora humi]MCC9308083.1 TetR/AcrR family transcriptional regulator C-terminal domain-containing protein [Kitasatospora humi]